MEITIMNRKDWMYFKMNDLFIFKKGNRLTAANMVSGDVPFISSTKLNNGIRQYIANGVLKKANCITVNYNGSVGEAFYQEVAFIASDDVNLLYPKNWQLNKNIALFLCSVIRHNQSRFQFGRKWHLDRMKETMLLLPQKNGNPDWEFMEDYIKSLEHKIVFKNIKTKNERKYQPLDMRNWKEFMLCGENGLFIYQHGNRLIVPQRVIGDIPFITAGKINQGYAQSISNYDEDECFDTGITIDMFANCFYHNFKFAADDNIYVFNKKQKINKYIALFLVTIINKQQYKYGYGRQFRKDDAEKCKFLLPVAKDGQPDWEFMENYIKNLPYGDLI